MYCNVVNILNSALSRYLLKISTNLDELLTAEILFGQKYEKLGLLLSAHIYCNNCFFVIAFLGNIFHSIFLHLIILCLGISRPPQYLWARNYSGNPP